MNTKLASLLFLLPVLFPLSGWSQEIPAEEIVRQLESQGSSVSKDLQISGNGQAPENSGGLSRQFVRAGPGSNTAAERSVNFSSITFEFDSDEISDSSMRQLEQIALALSSKSLTGKSFELIGHTDAKGSSEYNLDLSNRRAIAVLQYLNRRHGIPMQNINAQGLGESRLINLENPYSSDNRRVEIISR